jgi:hypothetical protein
MLEDVKAGEIVMIIGDMPSSFIKAIFMVWWLASYKFHNDVARRKKTYLH